MIFCVQLTHFHFLFKLNAANIQLLLSISCVPVCVLVDNFEGYMKREIFRFFNKSLYFTHVIQLNRRHKKRMISIEFISNLYNNAIKEKTSKNWENSINTLFICTNFICCRLKCSQQNKCFENRSDRTPYAIESFYDPSCCILLFFHSG